MRKTVNIFKNYRSVGPQTQFRIVSVACLVGILVLCSCGTGSENHCMGEIETPCIPREEPHGMLSEYGLFKGDISNLEPVEGLLPFDLSTPLFSDYADKLRMVYLPDGASVTYRESGALDFPVGSVLVKTFFYPFDKQNPEAGRKLLETRLLIRKEQRWTAETYAWNERQSEAVLLQVGETKQVEWIDETGIQRQVDYLIPSKNDCSTCHSHNGRLIPLGPNARNLNKIYAYADGEENQLIRWEKSGFLKDKPVLEQIPKAPVWNDSSTGTLNERARIYLDVNCGNCHHPAGFANYTSLFLNLEEDRAFNLGIYKMPVAFGAGDLKYDIIPGEPDSSIMTLRMESVEPEIRMPEIGRTLVHEEGVALIRAWIDSLDCSTCE